MIEGDFEMKPMLMWGDSLIFILPDWFSPASTYPSRGMNWDL